MDEESIERQQYWLSVAFERVRRLAETQLAFSAIESEARISESTVFGEAKPQPHHVERARTSLLRSGELSESVVTGKGGREIRLFQVADVKGRAKQVQAAAMRKRALMTRYYGWAQGTASYPGITGPAAEAVVHETLVRSGMGNLLSSPTARTGNIDTFLGEPVPIGPLDNGFLFVPLDKSGRIRFQPPVGVPVEVKNVREWIYPRSRELYQLLAKASQLQQKLPDVPLVPVLVCRRASTTAHRMAKAFGFYIIQARQQFILEHSRAPANHLAEVRGELGLADLVVPSGPSKHVRAGLDALRETYDVSESTDLWNAISSTPEITTKFVELARDIAPARRAKLLNELRGFARDEDFRLGW